MNYSQPPSSTFKYLNGKHKNNEEIAKQLLLPTSEIEMWSNHLDKVQEARKSGAKKAAATRKAKKQQRGNSFLWFAFLFIIYWQPFSFMLTESRNEEQDDAQDEEHEDQLWCYCQEPEYG